MKESFLEKVLSTISVPEERLLHNREDKTLKAQEKMVNRLLSVS